MLLARSGEEAIAKVAAEHPDCILMDIRMPTIDGIVACERIRALPGGDSIAIVFVTALRDVATFDRAEAAGGDDFITKPYRPDELLIRVQTALRLRRIAAERSELYAQLKHQRDQLQRLELQKEQLVAFLVHDLKNPVNAIELLVQAVIRAKDLVRSRAAATKIHEETHGLLRMITNLLDISKADEGQLVPSVSAIDAGELAQRALEELEARASASSVRIATRIDTSTVRADRDLISRVLANLLDNAIRHAPADSDVRMAISRVADGVEIRVADAGPGVPEHMRESVFERFRSGAETAGSTNRGLGLAFCKLAVEAHGGRIWIEDGAPGAVFCVSLPRAAPPVISRDRRPGSAIAAQ